MATQTLSGRVLFANNTPAPSVKVRAFDGDIGSCHAANKSIASNHRSLIEEDKL